MSPFKIFLSVIAFVSIMMFLFCMRLVLLQSRKIQAKNKSEKPTKENIEVP